MKRSQRPIPPNLKHGTIGAYSNWACRCDKCKQANAQHVAKWRARKKAEATK